MTFLGRFRFVLIPTGLLLIAVACMEPVRVEYRVEALGRAGTIEVWAVNRDAAQQAVDTAARAVERVDAVLNRRRQDSEISRLNKAVRSGAYTVKDEDLYRCLRIGLEYARVTDGALDPTAGALADLYRSRPPGAPSPAEAELRRALAHVGRRKVKLVPELHAVQFRDPDVQVDLDELACGYALDAAARAFALPGVRGGLLRLGDSQYAWSHPPGQDAWTVLLGDPAPPDRLGTVRVTSRAVTTAGSYAATLPGEVAGAEPILDARTGEPARSDVVAVSVIADSGVDADALSASFLLLGSRRAGDLLTRGFKAEAVMLVRREGRLELLASASLRDRLVVDPEFARRTGVHPRFLLPPS